MGSKDGADCVDSVHVCVGSPAPDASPAAAPAAAGGAGGAPAAPPFHDPASIASAIIEACGVVVPADLPGIVAAVVAEAEKEELDWAEPVPCDMCGYVGIPGLDLWMVTGKWLCAGPDDCAKSVRDGWMRGWVPGCGADWENEGVTQRWHCWREGGVLCAGWFTPAAWEDVRSGGFLSLPWQKRASCLKAGELVEG